MGAKRFVAAAVGVFVLSMLLGFVIHTFLLGDDYKALSFMMRSEADQGARMPYMMLGFALYSLALVWLYTHGISDAPWMGQGIRFGIAVWAIGAAFPYLVYYTVQPWPMITTVKAMGFDLINYLAGALLTAFVYRNAAKSGKA